MENSEKKYSLSPDFVADERDNTVAAIMNLETGEIFEMQGSGVAIVYALVNGHTRTEIVSRLLNGYDVSELLAKKDVDTLIEKLLSTGALVVSRTE